MVARSDEEKLNAFMDALREASGMSNEGKLLHGYYSGFSQIGEVQDSMEEILGLLYSLQFIAHTGARKIER